MSKGQWLNCFRPNPTAKTRLICIHHAGGAASAFYNWRGHLPPDVELIIAQLPGRESRLSEPLSTNTDVVISSLAAALTPYQDKPYIFFGHSLGGRIAYRLAHFLFEKGSHMPRRLLISASRPPHVPPRDPPITGLSDSLFIKGVMARYGGFSAEFLKHPDFMAMQIPIIRSDMRLYDQFSSKQIDPIPVPLSVIGGKSDKTISLSDLEAWRAYTTQSFSLQLFDGEHFFLTSYQKQIINLCLGLRV